MTDHRAAVQEVAEIISDLYALVARLEKLFPGRLLTPDGHLVGSIGEVAAAHRYGLQLLPHSYQGHDARAPDGRFVEIKAIQGKSVATRDKPRHLIVLQLSRTGEAAEIYNDPGAPVWSAFGRTQSNGSSLCQSQVHVAHGAGAGGFSPSRSCA